MSDSSAPSPRPVALITTLFIFAVVAIGWVVVSRLYEPTSTSPQNAVAENLPKELAWKATPATRKQALGELREKHAQQSTSYAWIDKNAGVVQLPIERAMQLTAAHYGSKK